jgi:hypothetical protein
MLFLDNTQVHVEAARACGVQAILFEDTTQALAALESQLQASWSVNQELRGKDA